MVNIASIYDTHYCLINKKIKKETIMLLDA